MSDVAVSVKAGWAGEWVREILREDYLFSYGKKNTSTSSRSLGVNSKDYLMKKTPMRKHGLPRFSAYISKSAP